MAVQLSEPLFQHASKQVAQYLSAPVDAKWLIVSLDQQVLFLLERDTVLQSYPISSSRFGAGNLNNSYRTPTGVHRIADRIGAGCRRGEIFKARVPTGQIAELSQATISAGDDVITSRILWLEGLQDGFNRGGDVDSYRRYIYIHGTAEEGLVGQPASIGCIRMRNDDVINLFDLVSIGTAVFIG